MTWPALISPLTVLLDGKGDLFADVRPTFILIRKGYEAEDGRLRKLAAGSRHAAIRDDREGGCAPLHQPRCGSRMSRIFDAKTAALIGPMSVLVHGKEIAAIEPPDSPATRGEVTVDEA